MIKEKVAEILKQAILKSSEKGLLVYKTMPVLLLETPKRKEHGDFATNIAMLFNSETGKPPRDIALVIKDHMEERTGIVERVEIAGPGFINIFIARKCWYDLLRDVTLSGDTYGRKELGRGRKVQVEFVSANPTGPLHIGHGRGAAIGDTIARLLEFVGYNVTREYYINDVGKQMETLGLSVLQRYREILGEKITFPEEGYQGRYIIDIAREILDKEEDRFMGGTPEEHLPYFIKFSAVRILEDIKKTLKDFGIVFDVWSSEKNLFDQGKVLSTIDCLKEKGLLCERSGALWFVSTEFGDDKDRVLRKADGKTTYFASDIAYHKDKFERGFQKIVDIWGVDHHGYQPRIRAFLKAMGIEGRLDILFVQLVTLSRSGAKIPMSTRGGQFIALREVINEVGRDAARFFFLLRRPDSPLEFDLELAKKETPENPVFYIQYAHARICSIMVLAKERRINIPFIDEIDVNLLDHQEEIDIIKAVVAFPEVVKDCALSLEPHHLTFYLQNLASIFHSYYNKNRVISGNKSLTLARLYLCLSVKVVLKNCLSLLGVSAPEKM